MDTREAYNSWSAQYDTNINKTRDLEADALRLALADITFDKCLEIGCGTGKNTVWLLAKAKHVTAVDLSEEMLAKAKAKITSEYVEFVQADITNDWTFVTQLYDLVTFSLVLEHIENLEPVFKKAAQALRKGGYVYVGELHPFKQYIGSKARFENDNGTHVVECYNHHVSDFISAAKMHGLITTDIKEYFDDDNRNEIPRILNMMF
ncbi:MAG: class I SAM-dependent methyltransferase, partial [Panacibacter sp.]